MTALMHAARCNQADMVLLLLKHPETNAALRDSTGWTALHWAAAVAAEPCAQHLAAHQPQLVAACTENEETCLHYAARVGSAAVCQTLLSACASQPGETRALLHAQQFEGLTALQLALANNHAQVVQLLHQVGSLLEQQPPATHQQLQAVLSAPLPAAAPPTYAVPEFPPSSPQFLGDEDLTFEDTNSSLNSVFGGPVAAAVAASLGSTASHSPAVSGIPAPVAESSPMGAAPSVAIAAASEPQYTAQKAAGSKSAAGKATSKSDRREYLKDYRKREKHREQTLIDKVVLLEHQNDALQLEIERMRQVSRTHDKDESKKKK